MLQCLIHKWIIQTSYLNQINQFTKEILLNRMICSWIRHQMTSFSLKNNLIWVCFTSRVIRLLLDIHIIFNVCTGGAICNLNVQKLPASATSSYFSTIKDSPLCWQTGICFPILIHYHNSKHVCSENSFTVH